MLTRMIVYGTLLASLAAIATQIFFPGRIGLLPIGILAGIGVRLGRDADTSQQTRGYIACGIALCVGLLTCLGSAYWLIAPMMQKDRLVTLMIAKEMVASGRQAGERMELPAGITLETAIVPAHFPAGIWEQAVVTTNHLSPAERTALEQDLTAQIPELSHGKWPLIGKGFLATLRGSVVPLVIMVIVASAVGSAEILNPAQAEQLKRKSSKKASSRKQSRNE